MPVNYGLKYMENVLAKMHISQKIILLEQASTEYFDLGLRHIAGRDKNYRELTEISNGLVKERSIYKLTDDFLCNYLFLQLPNCEEKTALLIGPYIKIPMDPQRIRALAQDMSVPPARLSALEDCYSNIPFLADDSFLYAMVNTLGEILWDCSGNFVFTDINLEQLEISKAVFHDAEEPAREEMLLSMHIMEQRYNWEKELMLMVSRGQGNRAKKMIPDMAALSFKQRLADPIRNMKNYCIICNTLMRKAAQQGGVHPLYLDKISTEFALKIEAQNEIGAVRGLIVDMIEGYCRLVREYSMKDYSRHVRHAILLIDAQLTNELSLRHVAAALELNPSYLSKLFKEETGSSLTEYVCRRRMEEATRLLRSSTMQIQDVALYCGIPDANYFTKLFKKHFGCTPAQYRNRG